MIALRVIWLLIVGTLYNLVLWLPLFLLGLVLMPVACLCGHNMVSPITKKEIFNAPWWLWIWGNDEDGILPRYYHPFTVEKDKLGWSSFRITYVWAALRNSVDNLKYVPWINPPVLPVYIIKVAPKQFHINSTWSFIWWKGYGCLTFRFYNWYRFGWRLTSPGFTAEKI